MLKFFFTWLACAMIAPLLFASSATAKAVNEVPKPHEGWDHLWMELMIDITAIGVVFALVTIYLLIKYRGKNKGDLGTAKPLKPLAAFGWVFIPAFLFIADDIYLGVKSMDLWFEYRRPPANSYTVDIEGYMWGYDITYPEGIEDSNELRVPVDTPIKVKLSSSDVIHTLFIPDLRTKWDMLPGKTMELWFYPDKVGEHVMTCSEFCGAGHSTMYGKIIVMPKDEFARWIEEQKADLEPKGEEMTSALEEQTAEQTAKSSKNEEMTAGGEL